MFFFWSASQSMLAGYDEATVSLTDVPVAIKQNQDNTILIVPQPSQFGRNNPVQHHLQTAYLNGSNAVANSIRRSRQRIKTHCHHEQSCCHCRRADLLP